jgi:UMF1 family MFS transporter
VSGAARGGLLQRLALSRPEQRAWALYDWANSAMMTVIITAVFPVFFAKVAYLGDEPAVAASYYGLATTVALMLVAIVAPLLGVIADHSAQKKRFLGGFMALGAASCAGMFFIAPGQWPLAALLFMLANIGASGSFVFYDALLPHVARDEELDALSTSGFALGYLGGGLAFALGLVLITQPGLFGLPSGEGLDLAASSLPTRLTFVLVALWWALFSAPVLLRVPEPPPAGGRSVAEWGGLWRAAFGSVRETTRDLLRYRQASLLLVAFLIYNDGIATMIRMAAVYGEELALDTEQMMLALLLVQFVGIPATLLFGRIARWVGTKRAILGGVATYLLISVVARGLTTTSEFYVMAGLVALVQGGTQALSRSLFASMIPRAKSGEFFGLFAVFDRFAGIFGPAMFTLAITWRGDVRDGILPIAACFLVGFVLLLRVDVERGRAEVLALEG